MLDELYSLPANARHDFEADGFVHLSEVLDGRTVAEYEPAVTDKVIELNTTHLPMSERTTYQKAFLQVTNLWRHSEAVRELVFSRRLAAIAAGLLGVDGVRLYHDQALYKEAGGGLTPWHADQYYWPLSTDRSITVWIPLQETPLEMGPLAFARGSHRFSFGRDLSISDESETALRAALAEQNFPLVEEPFAVGDVSYHLGWTFHRASPNGTSTPRRVMTIIYIDADITVAEPVNENQRIDREAWFGDTPVGQVPDTELTPILYRR
ncbi:phytanoyl-CoA dioxygenase family protein [Micromonospora sp. DR5-3]|uniref:phytanoyl-CoA dioxygenase family protein n=1 Tax=unclassified Micromonospora TaxID=2617518 RepID=UPI0011D2F022|nr:MULTISPECIES: phytanoyl-CoA dioxygenase family protein [unclassified Micromonospora]MCW3820525.1 phytanoyl-CoA dioxygenase family protein [Micromonospora sp. DR5-3]TYC19244.1 phytanoyl-CoA dioxygenase family protein [Micromonospora sp. MP36]